MQCWGVVSVHKGFIFLEHSQAFQFLQVEIAGKNTIVFHEFIFGKDMVQFQNYRKEQP